MSTARRRPRPRGLLRDALAAGALVGGLFLSLLGVLRAVIRLNLLPRGEVTLLLPLAIAVVMVPLAAGIKLGYRDNTPPSLGAYRHVLPWSRSPTEELLGAVLGGAFWAALGIALSWIAERLSPAPGASFFVFALFGPALTATALYAIHGRGWSAFRAFLTVLVVDLLLAAPQLALGPRGPLGGPSGLAVLARENLEAAEHQPDHPALHQRALSLATRSCAAGHARACFLASFALSGHEGSREAVERMLRRGCDLTTTDLAPCTRYVGEGFAPASACSVEQRCAGAYGVDCRAGLLGCHEQLGASSYRPVCARREPQGWREVWCAQPAASSPQR